jgi:hypothetical protein
MNHEKSHQGWVDRWSRGGRVQRNKNQLDLLGMVRRAFLEELAVLKGGEVT